MLRHLFFMITSALILSASGQVEINQSLHLTGQGEQARITGIRSVLDTTDAVNLATLVRGQWYYLTAENDDPESTVIHAAPIAGAGSAYVILAIISNSLIFAPVLFRLKSPVTNDGAMLLQVSGLGEAPIVKIQNNPLLSGDIQEGQWLELLYDGDYFYLLNPFNQPRPKPCPPGFSVVNDSYCIQNNEGITATDYYAAISACMAIGARPCTMAEFYYACSASVPGVSGMNNANWEWVSDIAGSYQHSGVDYVQAGYNDCTASQVVDGALSNGGARVRCCFSR